MNDLSALRRMILQVLMRTSNFDLELEQQKDDVIAGYLARLHMPEDIGNFLNVLNDETLLGNVDLSWLLNDPAFWDEKKRRLWIADLWECVNSSEKGTSNVFNRYLANKHKKWRETVVEGSGWHDVVKRNEADKLRYGVQNGVSEKNIDFHELTRFYRHSIEHYDRMRIGTREEIDQALNETFSYPCSGLRLACTNSLFHSVPMWSEEQRMRVIELLSNF